MGTWSTPLTPCTPKTTTGARPAPWIRDVLADAARTRLVKNIVGQLLNGVSEPVLLRAFEYLRNVDKGLGDRVEQGVRAAQP
jgi:catalase